MEQYSGSQEGKQWPTPLASSLLYLTVLSLMILSSFLFGGRDFKGSYYYIFMFVLQFIMIALPPLVYLLYKRADMRVTARLSPLRVPEVLLVIGMAVFGYAVIVAINLVWFWFLSRFGTPQPTTLPPIETGQQYLMAILVIALVPALFEEFLFRGVIQRGYERIGLTVSIVFSGILFAFLHLSIVSLPSIILLGILLCYVVYRSNSIWAGVIYHFVNNSIAVTLAFVSNLLTNLFPLETPAESLVDLPTETLLAGMVVWGFLGVIALGLFAACFAGFHILTRGRQNVLVQRTDIDRRTQVIDLLPAVFAMVVVVILLVMEVIEMVSPVL